MAVALCPAELLVLTGTDAAAFAHAQFTSDVKSLRAGAWQWSAWLDAQGRVRNFFALLHVGPEQWIAWLPLGGAQAMRDALARFVLRSKVQLEARTDWTLHRLAAGALVAPPAADEIVPHDAGFALAQTGARVAWLAPTASAGADAEALEQWRRDDIAGGLPLLAPALGGEFVPQALDLERLDAIRFDKGCYPGQEVAARLHFRGGNKRHLRRLAVDAGAPPTGSAILDGTGRTIGRILYAASTGTRASTALGVLADAQGASPLTTAGATVRVLVAQDL